LDAWADTAEYTADNVRATLTRSCSGDGTRRRPADGPLYGGVRPLYRLVAARPSSERTPTWRMPAAASTTPRGADIHRTLRERLCRCPWQVHDDRHANGRRRSRVFQSRFM